jgi:hypothetical protein
LFWGSLVPQLSAWQLAAWPSQVSDYLLNEGGYTAALHTMNADQLPDGNFQNSSRAYLGTLAPGWNVLDAPVGVQYMGTTNLSIPVGIGLVGALLSGQPHRPEPGLPGGEPEPD